MAELLVVIAILAVLLTVSVAGYASFTERAKLSKDSVLLEQCNTVLDICAVYEGHNRTVSEALSNLSENGIEPADLKASAKNCDIVWNRTADRFLLVRQGTVLYPSTEESVALSDCFLTVHRPEEINGTYSVHLAEDFIAQAELCLNNVGFDDGGNAVSFSLSGDTDEELVVNTVGGSATVNLPNGTVKHYGDASQVTVEAIGDASYHVFGQIERFTLYSGHLVLEVGATINELRIFGGTVLCRKGAAVSVSAEDAEAIENQGGTVRILPTEADEPDAPNEPTEPEEPSKPTVSVLFAGGDGSKEHPYLISTPQQFSKIAALMAHNYSEREETISVPYLEEKRIYAADYKLKDGFCRIKSVLSAPCKEPGEHDFDELPDAERQYVQEKCEENGLDLEALGKYGLKYTIEEDCNGKVDSIIYYELKEAKTTETLSQGEQYYYFRLTESIVLPIGYTPISAFYGELDGAGYSLSAPAKSTAKEQACVIFKEALGGSVFKNFEFRLSQQPYSLVGGDEHRTNGRLQFENITIAAQEEGTCVKVLRDGFGALTRYALHSWNAEVVVKNCINRADFDFHDTASAVFVGERYLELYPKDREIYDNSTATFVECGNFGTLSGTACRVWCVGVVSIDAGAFDEDYPWLSVEACTEQTQP